MKRISCFSIGFSAALSGLLLTGCGRQASDGAGEPAQPPAVTVAVLQAETVTLTRELPGRTNPYVVAEVRPQVTGIIEERLFVEGGLVEAGEALYQLDDATYQADVASAEAALARARSSLELARINAERVTGLFEANATSQQERDDAVAQLRQAEADVAFAEASLASARVLLNYSLITSPITGRIGRSAFTQGALVTANQPAPLAVVQQLDPIYVDLTWSAREWLEMRREMAAGNLEETGELPVKLLLEDGSEYGHAGTVAFSEVSVDATTGQFGVRVVAPNPDHLLLPGMYVRAVLSTGVRPKAILAPQQGIIRQPSGATVAMVVGKDGIVEQRPVVVRRTIGHRWLVEEGLAPGDRIVIEGLQYIEPGVEVRVTETREAAGQQDSDRE